MVDLGSAFHATPHRKHFHDYVQGHFQQVCLGDERALDIIGKGKVLINLENENQWLLKDVKHVVGLKKEFNFNRTVGKMCNYIHIYNMEGH